MAILVGGHPELSTCKGYFSSGKQPSQVDNSGCPPPKKAIIVYWHYDRGLNNSKLTIWSLITVADGDMRVWHFNGVITTYGKRDCRNSWQYVSLAVIRGAIKCGFTAPLTH